MTNQNKAVNDSTDLPAPGKKKQNPQELDRMLDGALENSMPASDPPAVAQPDVKKSGFEEDTNKIDTRTERGKQVGHKI